MKQITLKHYEDAIIITSSDKKRYEFKAFFHDMPQVSGYGNDVFQAVEHLLIASGLRDGTVLMNLSFGEEIEESE